MAAIVVSDVVEHLFTHISPTLEGLAFDTAVDDPVLSAGFEFEPDKGDTTHERSVVSDEPQVGKVAYRGEHFIDDFYYRIHINPAELALGDLLTDAAYAVEIWNAFFRPATVQALDVVNADSINTQVDPTGGAYPYEMAALQSMTYEIAVLVDGPANIDASYDFTIDGAVYSLAITGSRLVVFPFKPNWRDTVSEAYHWLTEIQESFDKTEDRTVLREYPRRALAFNALLSGESLTYAQSHLWGWQNRYFGVPYWPRVAKLSAAAQIGDEVLAIAHDRGGFVVGGNAILLKGEREFETVAIDAIDAGQLTLARGLDSAWGAGTLLYPIFRASAGTKVSWAAITDGVAEVAFNFEFVPSTVGPYLPDDVAPMQYEGADVLTRQPNWVSALQNSSNFPFDTYDYGFAQILDETAVHPNMDRVYTWLMKSYEEVDQFLAIMARLKGRANTLWAPTWRSDFICTDTIAAASTLIDVKDIGYHRFINLSPARDRIFMQLRSGDVFIRRITDATETSIAIDNSLGVTVEPEDILRISYLDRCRSFADSYSVNWATAGVAQASVMLYGVSQ